MDIRRIKRILLHTATPSSPTFSRINSSTASGAFRHGDEDAGDDNGGDTENPTSCHKAPMRQLMVLAVISLAEQTALNSISPYLPHMVASFPESDPDKVGLYVGVIASCFACAQVATTFLWGRLSDRIGRKPVILVGTFGTALGFLAFGFVSRLWQAAAVQAFIGLVNGNAGVVSTVLGEITDKSNQSTFFAYLPVVYGLGSIFGPIMGGLLTGLELPSLPIVEHYPYILPNILSAAILLADFVFSMLFLDESLSQAQALPPLGRRVHNFFAWLWQFTAGAVHPSYLQRRFSHYHPHKRHRLPTTLPVLFPRPQNSSHEATADEEFKETVLSTPALLLLAAYFIFNLSSITYSFLYPTFVSTPSPVGLGFSPRAIGLTQSLTALAAILFQAFTGIGTDLQTRWSSAFGFRLSMFTLALTFFLMPLVTTTYINTHTIFYATNNPSATLWGGKWFLYGSVSIVLVLKSIANIVGLTCALIMFTNLSPGSCVLGRINGLAQTLAAAGRAIGPFLGGGVWTLAVKKVNGGIVASLAWGVFGGVCMLGMAPAMGIRELQIRSEDEGDDVDDGESSSSIGSDVLVDDDETTEIWRGGREQQEGDRERERLLSRGG